MSVVLPGRDAVPFYPLALATAFLAFEALRTALEAFRSQMVFATDNREHILLPVLYISPLRKSSSMAGLSLGPSKVGNRCQNRLMKAAKPQGDELLPVLDDWRMSMQKSELPGLGLG